jgi:hypothetical protein
MLLSSHAFINVLPFVEGENRLIRSPCSSCILLLSSELRELIKRIYSISPNMRRVPMFPMRKSGEKYFDEI